MMSRHHAIPGTRPRSVGNDTDVRRLALVRPVDDHLIGQPVGGRGDPGHSQRCGRSARCEVGADSVRQLGEANGITRIFAGTGSRLENVGSLEEKLHARTLSHRTHWAPRTFRCPPETLRDRPVASRPMIGTLDPVPASGNARTLGEPPRPYTHFGQAHLNGAIAAMSFRCSPESPEHHARRAVL